MAHVATVGVYAHLFSTARRAVAVAELLSSTHRVNVLIINEICVRTRERDELPNPNLLVSILIESERSGRRTQSLSG
jgi:hypothetical protein